MAVNDIDRQAAEWAEKADGGVFSPEDAAALNAWLAADKRHMGAYVRVAAVHARVERLDASILRSEDINRAKQLPRRSVLAGTVAASLVAVAIAGNFAWNRLHENIYSTAFGEMKVVVLSDGSTVTLNTETKAVVHYTDARRTITLARGEAIFDVAKNKVRQFVVNAGDVHVRAVGTSFAVRSTPDRPLEVLVREGTVRIEQPNAAAVLLSAPSRAMIRPNSPILGETLTPLNVAKRLAWKSGHIYFQNASLASAAREFARYSRMAIVISDPAVAGLTVTGNYASDDPVGFAKAVAVSLDLTVSVENNEVRLTRAGNTPASDMPMQ